MRPRNIPEPNEVAPRHLNGRRRHQEAKRRCGPGAEWTDNTLQLEQSCQMKRMHRPGAAKGEHRVLAQIHPPLRRIDARRGGHRFIDDLLDSGGGLPHRQTGRLRYLFPNGRLGGTAVEGHAPTEKRVGIDVTESEIGIGYRRRQAATAVTRGSGFCSRAVRPDLDEPHAVDLSN